MPSDLQGIAMLNRNCLSLTALVFISPFSRFNFQDETPTTNFDTFPAAILTVFQVKRPLILHEHWKINSWASLPASGDKEVPGNPWALGKGKSFLLMYFATLTYECIIKNQCYGMKGNWNKRFGLGVLRGLVFCFVFSRKRILINITILMNIFLC